MASKIAAEGGRIYRRGSAGVWWMDFRAAGRRYRRSTGWRDECRALASTRDALLVAKAEHMNGRVALSGASGWTFDARAPWVRTMFAQAKRNAKRRRIEFLLSAADLSLLLRATGGRCALTNIPFSNESVGGWHPYGPSLDRIESGGHYTAANCRIICCAANMACHAWGEDVFRKMARAMVAAELLAATGHETDTDSRSQDNINRPVSAMKTDGCESG